MTPQAGWRSFTGRALTHLRWFRDANFPAFRLWTLGRNIDRHRYKFHTRLGLGFKPTTLTLRGYWTAHCACLVM